MKTAVYHRYGGPEVVTITQLDRPVPADNEVLVRIAASTVSSGDWRARSLSLPAGMGLIGRLVFGVFAPRQPILGGDFSGTVAAVGSAVTSFKIGDEVIGYPGAKLGSHAEYRTMPADGLIVRKPAALSFEQAAALCFGGTTALNFLRDKGNIRPGEHVAIVGASGAVGSAAVQIAKSFGAEVTAVTSAKNADLVRSLGSDHVVDYETEDFAGTSRRYDIVLNANAELPFSRVKAALRPGGRLLLVLGSARQMLGLDRPPRGSDLKVIGGVSAPTRDDIQALADLAESGRLTPVIDRIYPLDSAREAHAYVDSGRKRGNVVLTMA
jgi:NADPH:quinone reductase-like Zn-dependent oxidoreductase